MNLHVALSFFSFTFAAGFLHYSTCSYCLSTEDVCVTRFVAVVGSCLRVSICMKPLYVITVIINDVLRFIDE